MFLPWSLPRYCGKPLPPLLFPLPIGAILEVRPEIFLVSCIVVLSCKDVARCVTAALKSFWRW